MCRRPQRFVYLYSVTILQKSPSGSRTLDSIDIGALGCVTIAFPTCQVFSARKTFRAQFTITFPGVPGPACSYSRIARSCLRRWGCKKYYAIFSGAPVICAVSIELQVDFAFQKPQCNLMYMPGRLEFAMNCENRLPVPVEKSHKS